MENYKQLSYGSTGDEVVQLQNKLIDNGYGDIVGNADGVFGAKTQKAVKEYQKANGLAVDGIAGKDTLGSLNTGSAKTDGGSANVDNPTTATADPATNPSTANGNFAGNDDPVVNEAWNVLNQNQGNKPGEYSPVWQDEADAYLKQYQNRDHFSYDFNSDALYQQYKDNYIQQGQMAMMDAMGQAAAMTGGYGNSYAQAAGQQAYNQYLSQLNAVMPELYQMAHDRYTQEGQNMLDMYDLYMNKENYEYNKYQDALNNWYLEDSRNYQKERDEVADKQWQATFDENKRQNDIANQQTQQKYYASNYDEEAAAKQQKLVAAGYDIAVDGIWGPESIKAWNDYNSVDDTGITKSRQVEIETWVVKACANANSASFDPRRVIKGSSWLKSDAEREYAYAVVDAMTNMN